MMYNQLYQYLLQHHELAIPGTGTFLIERKVAVIDFPNKRIDPPVYTIAMQTRAATPANYFFTWLAHALHIDSREAMTRFNDFSHQLEKQIAGGTTVEWNGVGILSRGLGGEVKFVPAKQQVQEKPITAEKVIRGKAEHMVRVGEDQKTSAEMEEMLNRTETKKSFWWAYAVAVGLLAIMFIGWYFSEHGVDLAATANNKYVVPVQPEPSYKVLP